MKPIAAIISAARNIHRLGGRAPRREYWWVFGTLIGGIIFASIIDEAFLSGETQQSFVYSILNLAFIGFYVPMLCLTLSVTIRRLHDLDMSAWFMLLYFLPLGLGFIIMGIICSRKGTPGHNRFGPNPNYVDVFSDIEEFG